MTSLTSGHCWLTFGFVRFFRYIWWLWLGGNAYISRRLVQGQVDHFLLFHDHANSVVVLLGRLARRLVRCEFLWRCHGSCGDTASAAYCVVSYFLVDLIERNRHRDSFNQWSSQLDQANQSIRTDAFLELVFLNRFLRWHIQLSKLLINFALVNRSACLALSSNSWLFMLAKSESTSANSRFWKLTKTFSIPLCFWFLWLFLLLRCHGDSRLHVRGKKVDDDAAPQTCYRFCSQIASYGDPVDFVLLASFWRLWKRWRRRSLPFWFVIIELSFELSSCQRVDFDDRFD